MLIQDLPVPHAQISASLSIPVAASTTPQPLPRTAAPRPGDRRPDQRRGRVRER